MDREIIVSNFNFCPLIQSAILGVACIECEHVKNIEGEYFCMCEEDEDKDQLAVKDIINKLLDLLAAGHSTVNRDEIIRLITDM